MNTESSAVDTLNFTLFVKNFTGGAENPLPPTVPAVPAVSVPATGKVISNLSPSASQTFSSTSSANPITTSASSVGTGTSVGKSSSGKSSSNKILKYAVYALLIFLAYSYFTGPAFKKTRLSRSLSSLSSKLRFTRRRESENSKSKIQNATGSKKIRSAESAEYQQLVDKYLKNYY